MLKALNMVQARCQVGFSEKIVEKKSQIETENDKSFPFFKDFTHFCQILDKLRGIKCFKGSTRKELVRPTLSLLTP